MGEGPGLGIGVLQSSRNLALMDTSYFSRVLEAWMQLAGQAHIHRADVTHCWWRLQCLFRTRWVQWLSTPLRWWLEPQTQAQNMDFRHWLRLANRGCLLQLDTPNFLIEVR